MAITYFIQSKKNPASIYVRIREGKLIDAKAKTNFKVNQDFFKKGKIQRIKTPPKASAQIKNEIQEKNIALIELEKNLNNLRTDITTLLNNRADYEIINSDWLKNVVNPKKKDEIPDTLIGYFDYYLDFKKTSLKASTLKKLGTFKNRLQKYQDDRGSVIYLQEVNKRLSLSLQKWCDDNGYDHNTKVKTIKVVVTVCNHAEDNGKILHPDLKHLTKELKYKKAPFITLNFDEIQQIMDVELDDKRLDIARDWLIISCFTAQRISDFFIFKKERIIQVEGNSILDITQEKTETAVYIPLDDEVLKIIKKWGDDFPPRFSNNKDSNDAIYNRLIKSVCRKAKLNDIVTVKRKNVETKRYELVEVPKHKVVSSHIGRRSFSSNYDSYINNSLLRSATGHSTEKQFKAYVNKASVANAISLKKEMDRVRDERLKNISALRVIKNVSNQ